MVVISLLPYSLHRTFIAPKVRKEQDLGITAAKEEEITTKIIIKKRSGKKSEKDRRVVARENLKGKYSMEYIKIESVVRRMLRYEGPFKVVIEKWCSLTL